MTLPCSFGQAQKCGGIKPVKGIPTLPFMIIRSPIAIQTETDNKTSVLIHHY